MHSCIAAQRPTHQEDGPSPESVTVVLESCSFLHGTDRVSNTSVGLSFNLLSFSQVIMGHSPWRHMLIHRDRQKMSKELEWQTSGKPLHVPSGPSQVHHTFPTSYDGRLWGDFQASFHCPLRGIWTKTWLFSSVIAQITPKQDETIVSMPVKPLSKVCISKLNNINKYL